jgi:hypothetical protein
MKDFVVVKDLLRNGAENPSQQQKFTVNGWRLRYLVQGRLLL